MESVQNPSAYQNLLSGHRVGGDSPHGFQLDNRIVMAALGRGRADHVTRAPNELHKAFYGNRATQNGLIITECSAVSQDGDSYIGSANIYSQEQINGWKAVVDQVHSQGGKIFIQLWHAGRTAHPQRNLVNGEGVTPIGPSPIPVSDGGPNTLVGGDSPHGFQLDNRIVMAALGRGRADHVTRAPNELHKAFYGNRATQNGLIITECSAVSQDGDSYIGSANIYSQEQINGWKAVVDQVHSQGGKIFIQLWHAGRTAHPQRNLVNGEGVTPIGPSPIPVSDGGPNTLLPGALPKEATHEDIKELVQKFRKAAENAVECGFDGVEIHGAHGYIIDEFLRDGSNKRTDDYGGSIENRARLLLEILDEVAKVLPYQRIGVKLSPFNAFQSMSDSDPISLFSYVIKQLDDRQVGFVEVTEGFEFKPDIHAVNKETFFKDQKVKSGREIFKPLCKNLTYITNQGYTFDSAEEVVKKGEADLVSFGIIFVSNDNVVEKLQKGIPFNSHTNVKDPSKLGEYMYSQKPEGYTDISVYGHQ
eukprot:403358651